VSPSCPPGAGIAVAISAGRHPGACPVGVVMVVLPEPSVAGGPSHGGLLVLGPRRMVTAFSGSENPRVITRTVPSTSARDQSDLWRGLTFAIDRLDPIGTQSNVVPLPKWAHWPCETAGQKADKPGPFAAAASPMPGVVGWSCGAVRGSPRERASASIPTGDRTSFRVQWAGAPCPSGVGEQAGSGMHSHGGPWERVHRPDRGCPLSARR